MRFAWLVCILLLASCQANPAAPIEVTRAVEVTRSVEVTRPVEVTRVVEATRLVVETWVVEVTRVVEATRLVEVVVTATPAPTPVPPPTAKPVPRAKKLQPEAVIAAFKAAGLEAELTRPLTKDDYGIAPYVGEGIRFFVPSLGPELGGRVIEVENKDDFTKLKAFYDDLGKASAMLFSWTFARDNILVQINGDLPEAKAKQYEAALMVAK